MEAFATESALLRASKMAARSGSHLSLQTIDDKTAHVAAMTRLFVHSRIDWVEQRARTALAGISETDTLAAHLSTVRRFTRRDAVNTIALRRRIAARVIQQGKYAAG